MVSIYIIHNGEHDQPWKYIPDGAGSDAEWVRGYIPDVKREFEVGVNYKIQWY